MAQDKNLEMQAMRLAMKSQVPHCVVYPHGEVDLAFVTRGPAINSCPSDVWDDA